MRCHLSSIEKKISHRVTNIDNLQHFNDQITKKDKENCYLSSMKKNESQMELVNNECYGN